MRETPEVFESRKKDHIRIALQDQSQSISLSQFDQIQLTHEALPEIDFSEVDLATSFFGHKVKSPLFVSSMTAGFDNAVLINSLLAKVSSENGWVMGVGSQRKELLDPQAAKEWQIVRKVAPKAILMANIGVTQLIQSTASGSIDDIKRLVDNLQAVALIIHLNPLQEVLQKEGTPQFKGGLEAIKKVVQELSLPVVVKETGCGMSASTILKLKQAGVAAIDIAGAGGTHWGRVEGYRSQAGEIQFEAAQAFANWGYSTVASLQMSSETVEENDLLEIWGSGGVRSGLDAAKLIALGASKVGLAMPIMKAALEGEESLSKLMKKLDFELKAALFCTGSKNINELKSAGRWQWK